MDRIARMLSLTCCSATDLVIGRATVLAIARSSQPGSRSGRPPPNKESPMTVTVLYPEDRQIPDLALEQEVFGPEVRMVRAAKPRDVHKISDREIMTRCLEMPAIRSNTRRFRKIAESSMSSAPGAPI